jgi:hypothetical protein
MSTVRANAILDASGGNTATINSMTPTADSLQGFRNRIINGAMVIDQRNAGASVTTGTTGAYTYSLDRYAYYTTAASKFTIQQNAGSVTPPVGFNYYLGITSTSAYSSSSSDIIVLRQPIEAVNVGDLGFGTANAKTITLSFWVRSSLTGTFSGYLSNYNGSRNYPFTYSISAANTWEQKSITIAGDTSSTWYLTNTGNSIGMNVGFNLGSGSTYLGTANAWSATTYFGATGSVNVVGTNGATWYITGAQLEVGSVATPFERRDYGRELMMCQRYYYKTAVAASAIIAVGASANTTTDFNGFANFPVRLRTTPSALEQSGTASDYRWNGTTQIACSTVPTFSVRTTTDMWQVNFAVASGLTAGHAGSIVTNSGNGYLAWSAEL